MCALMTAYPPRAKRFAAQLPIKLLLDSRSRKSACDALTMDISPAGARVRAKVPLAPGQAVRVVPNEGIARAIPGRIVWVNRIMASPNGEAGIEFFRS
jgi:PilZ domain